MVSGKCTFGKMSQMYTYTSEQRGVKRLSRVGKKYRYAGIPRYFFGVVRTAAHLPVPRYSGVSIYSNRKPYFLKILTDLSFFQLQTIEFNLKMVCFGVLGTR